MAADRTAAVPRWAHAPSAALIILAAAIATRAVTFGNPLVDMDDQFYWLLGQEWWDGRWPIVDVWDRKPIGLFALYAAIAAIDRSILAVQIASLLFAAGTALLVRAAALRIASPRAALLGAITYLIFLPPFWGQSGQSPVFYNLFMAGAALVLLDAAEAPASSSIRARAYGAMLLSGFALVMKQVSVAEGIYVGLAFLWLLHRSKEKLAGIALTATAMVGVALVPTILGAAIFAFRGDGAVAAYVDASYLSIFAKTPGSGQSLAGGIAYLLLFGGALIIAAGLGLKARPADERSGLAHSLIGGWIVAALIGYLLVPNFFPHYALPLLVPLSVMAARAFDRPIGNLLFAALLISCLMTGRLTDWAGNRRAAHDFDHLAATIKSAVGKEGCLYVANGPVSLYTMVPDCGVTRYIFPYHLTLATESTAVDVDQGVEIGRIFAARPAIVVTQDDKRKKQTRSVQMTLDRHLAADYRPIAHFPMDAAEELRGIRVWQRKRT